MTIALVTGAPGWLGTRLVQTLAEGLADVPSLAGESGREIRVLAYRDADVSGLERIRGNIRIVRGDVTDASSVTAFMRGAEGATVFHAAGIIHPTQGIKQLYAVNELGTGHVLQAATAAGVRRFIHVSSNSPIGLNPSSDHVFAEDAPFHPYMHYGRSKKRAEDLVNAAGAAGPMETVIIRPPWFYGTGQPERQSRFIRMVRDGKAPIVGNGANRRSMAYIDNICQGLLLCETVAEASGRTYWIADERPYPMTEIIDTIEDVLARDFSVKVARKRLRLPGFLAEVAVAGDWVLQTAGLYVTPLHVLGEMNKTIACSIARARHELGYQPRVALREGMRRSIEWMLSNGETL
jgi:nucleoside-diphosphate-sugar epimerase